MRINAINESFAPDPLLTRPYPLGQTGKILLKVSVRWVQFSPFFPVLHCPLGSAELKACPFPDVVFPPLPLSALSFSSFHCAL